MLFVSCFYSDRFRHICLGDVKVPGMTVMKDVAITKSDLKQDEKVITKIQDFQHDNVLFEYCCEPTVRKMSLIKP